MFTGIITDIGEVAERKGGHYAIRCSWPADSIVLGASIACDGACLTVTGVTTDGAGSIFTADVSNETLSKTTLGSWQAGQAINLEAALKAGDELGGHLVTGHVDGVAEIVAIREDGDSRRFTLQAPGELARFVAPKGSVALSGTSLTVNEVSGSQFGINLIPHTLTHTTWGRKSLGELVNIEVDMFARYVARMMEFSK